MVNLPTIRQLRYLVALAETRHFGHAAQHCHVTQSTLSAGMRELETILGVQLFERTKRRVITTPLGLEIAAGARTALDSVEALVERAHAAQAPLTGPLRLGVIPTVGPFLLPRILPPLRENYPDLKLFLREDLTGRLLDQLRAGDLDLVIIAYPYDAPGTECEIFAEDDFLLACPEHHALCANKVIRTTDIPDDELILLEDGHCLKDHALQACHLDKAGANPRGAQGTSLSTLVQMVAGGLGITLLPRIAVGTGIIDNSHIALVPLEKGAAPRKLGLTWRSTSGRAEEFRILATFLRNNMEKH